MEELSVEEFQEKIKKGEINYYNIYNADMDGKQYYAIRYFIDHPNDTIDKEQILNILFFDIEVYHFNQEIEELATNDTGIVTAFSFYSIFEETYHAYINLLNVNKDKMRTDIDALAEEYRQELIQHNYLTENESIKIYIYYDQEFKMLTDCFDHIHSIDPIALSGFNCLPGDESVWTENKIVPIKEIQKDNITTNYGKINAQQHTGQKYKNIIHLCNGFNISCSDDHVFPLFTKSSKRFVDLSHFHDKNWWKDTKSKEIDLSLDNYVCIRKHTNKNNDITFKQLLVDNFDYYLECGLDFIIIDENIRSIMKRDHINEFTSETQYQGKNCWFNSKWKYSNLKYFFSKQTFIDYINNCNELYVYFNSKAKQLVNLNDTISNDLFYLLGLVYTDGSRSSLREGNYISNTDNGVINTCNEIMVEYNIVNDRNWHTNEDNVTYCKFGINNKLFLLFPLIYNTLEEKELNKMILSSISYNQFLHFFAGLFDGDGCYHKSSSALTVSIQHPDRQNDLKILGELLLWNGVFCSIQGNKVVSISNNQWTNDFISNLPLRHSEKQLSSHRNIKHCHKDSKSKQIRYKEDEFFVYVKIKDIVKSDNQIEMYDINTEKHYYETSFGIVTHNSDGFDLPYLYRRLLKLIGDENKVANIMSKFGTIRTQKAGDRVFCRIPEYSHLDIQYLYKPRDEQGLNYGKTQPSYSLDYISEDELNLKKLEYQNEGISLDKFYEIDPVGFLKYNIMDVALPVRLNEKLRHADLHNMLCRSMKTPAEVGMQGVSGLFDTYFSYEMERYGKKMRYNVAKDAVLSLDEMDINSIPKPKTKAIKNWTVTSINEREYNKILSRYPGAYVKEGANRVVTENDGLSIDLDAKSLYPSTMLQFNISFDTYYGKIIDPLIYNMLDNFLPQFLGTNKELPADLFDNLFNAVHKYVDKLEPSNKGEYKQRMYFMIANLVLKLKKANVPIENIVQPSNEKEYILLKTYLVPLFDLLTEVRPEFNEVNTFAYNYIINNEFNAEYIYIFENEYDANAQITKLDVNSFRQYLEENGLSVNISGALFYTHETKTGTLSNFLDEKLTHRDIYKKERDKYEKGSTTYEYYDRRQNAFKINANSSYGLSGMQGFRFSNKMIAKSTTLSGRLTLKISQMCGEIYLEQLKNQE